MSKTSTGIGVIILVAGGMAFYAQSRANAALQHEIAALRAEMRDAVASVRAGSSSAAAGAMPSQPTSNAASASAAVQESELAKLREEIASLRKSTTALTQFAQAAQAAQAAQNLAKTSDSVATKLTPANELKSGGRATPEASTETVMAAAVGGDVDTLAASLAFVPSARAKADEWFASLSDATRQQYGSAEKLIALMIARDAASLAGFQVLGQKEISPDNVGVRFRLATTSGQMKDDTVLMHRTEDGWKMMLNDAVVDKFAKQIGGKK